MTPLRFGAAYVTIAAALALPVAAAAQEAAHTITIRNHQFEPSTINVKAGVKIKLTIVNAQAQAAEFESNELNREKVIAAGAKATIFIGPLKPGRYPFFGEFNEKTAQGVVIAE